MSSSTRSFICREWEKEKFNCCSDSIIGLTNPFCFALAQNCGILEGRSKVDANCGALVYGYGWEVAAGIDVFKGHALGLTILEELDSTALQYVQVLQSLVDLILVLVVQM